MNRNHLVQPSSLVDSTLPNYIFEQYKSFVDFMEKSAESQERIGFGQDLLQNLQTYRDFNTYKHKIVTKGYLAEAISSDSDELELVDGYGYPDKNGILLIDDEVILYRRKEGNFFYELKRGAAATTVLPTYKSSGTYKKSCPAEHIDGAEVYNISVLFLVSILSNIHETYAPGIDSSRVCEEINHGTLLENLKDFYQSKGTKLGIKSLFKILFCENDVDVKYPGDQMIIPSTSTWTEDLILRTVPVPKVFCDPKEKYATPDKVIGSEVVLKSYNDDEIYARTVCEYVSSYPFEAEVQYEMILNEDNFAGEIIANPSTVLTRKVYVSGTTTDYRDVYTLTVESTLGFPDSGVLFVDNEAIYYKSKSPNQFFECTRGYIGVTDEHELGSEVRGPFYVETSYDYGSEENGCEVIENKVVSRSWPLGLVTRVVIDDPGLLHTLQDEVYVNGPGRNDPREPILDSIRENYDDNLATQSQAPPQIGDIRKYTYGASGVFYDADYVYVPSTNLPEYSVGGFSSDGSIGPDLKSQESIHVFPRRHKIEDNLLISSKGTDEIGMFVDGVPAISNVSQQKIERGRITKINVTNGGSGYQNPTVISNPNSGYLFTPILENGVISSVISIGIGSFDGTPEMRVSSGEGAVITPRFDRFGRLTSLVITNSGRHYKDVPNIRLVDSSGTGRGAILACEVTAGQISSVTVVNPGIDYRAGTTSVEITPIGSGATLQAEIETFTFDRYTQVLQNTSWTFDRGNGFLFTDSELKFSKFGYVCSPSELRRTLKDNGVTHSPILGWAYDGNPIYGPYGFINGEDSTLGIGRQETSYRLKSSRPGVNPPSSSMYPLGTFIEDYEFVGNGTLDEFNGKVCNTPDFPKEIYPDGVYCYFLTVNENQFPQYPYLIGDNFKNRPLSQNIQLIDEEIINPLNGSPEIVADYDDTLLTFDFRKLDRYRNPYLSSTKEEVEIEIADVSTGSVSEVVVEVPSPGTTSPGDFVFFNNEGTQGGGAEAKVDFVKGKKVIHSEGCRVITRLISHRQRFDLTNNVDENGDRKSYVFVKNSFFETTIGLNTGLGARARVNSYDPETMILEVQATSPNRVEPGVSFFDNRGELVNLVSGYDIVSQTGVRTAPSSNNVSIVAFMEPEVRYDASELVPGDMWWSITTGRLYVWMSDEWVCTQPLGTRPVDGASNFNLGFQAPSLPFNGDPPGDNAVTITAVAPSTRPDGSTNRIGDLWWCPNNGILYIWNSDILGCVSCGCDVNGNPIDVTSEWVCTDPAGIITLEGVSDEYMLHPNGVQPFDLTDPVYSTSLTCVVSDVAPAAQNDGNPLIPGNLWWSTITGKLYVYYDDGNTVQWVVANPSAMTSGLYSSDVGVQDGTGMTPGPFGYLPEKPDRELLYFQSLCDFYGGDEVFFTIGAPGVQGKSELGFIRGKNNNKGYHSMFIQRGYKTTDPIWLPDQTITLNASRAKYVISTIEPHDLRAGDTVRIENSIYDEVNGEHIVAQAGTISPAFGKAVLSPGPQGNEVIQVNLTDQGWGYPRNFYVQFEGGGGVGAYGLANVAPLSEGGYVKSVTMIDGGVNYTSDPTPDFRTACSEYYFSIYTKEHYGEDGAIYYSTSAPQCKGGPDTIKVTSGGLGYAKLPVAEGLYKREIDRAETKINLRGGRIVDVDIIRGGNRYSNPVAVFSDRAGNGDGAYGTVNVVNGVIESIYIPPLGQGSGYVDPVLDLVEMDGKFLCLTEDIGKIVAFNVLNPGRNISADKSLKPELMITTRVIIDYPDPEITTFGWEGGQTFYQGTEDNKLCSGEIIDYDESRQQLTLRLVEGFIRVDEMIYSNTGEHAIVILEGQADVEVEVSGCAKPEGRFIDDTSKISEAYAVIQDSYYYQLFSYVISSSLQQKQYKSFTDEITHPSGFVMFSDTIVRDSVYTQCRAEEAEIGIVDFGPKDIVIPIGVMPPTNPRVGNLWFRPTDGKMYIFYYDGESYQWIEAHVDTFRPYRRPAIPIGTTPPLNPQAGNLWFRSSDGRMYVYYPEGGWIDASILSLPK